MLAIVVRALMFFTLVIVFNQFQGKNVSPRYWNTKEFDSVVNVAVLNAALKTDSILGVNAYLEGMEKLKDELR